jgi:hypothetical protein
MYPSDDRLLPVVVKGGAGMIWIVAAVSIGVVVIAVAAFSYLDVLRQRCGDQKGLLETVRARRA